MVGSHLVRLVAGRRTVAAARAAGPPLAACRHPPLERVSVPVEEPHLQRVDPSVSFRRGTATSHSAASRSRACRLSSPAPMATTGTTLGGGAAMPSSQRQSSNPSRARCAAMPAMTSAARASSVHQRAKSSAYTQACTGAQAIPFSAAAGFTSTHNSRSPSTANTSSSSPTAGRVPRSRTPGHHFSCRPEATTRCQHNSEKPATSAATGSPPSDHNTASRCTAP